MNSLARVSPSTFIANLMDRVAAFMKRVSGEVELTVGTFCDDCTDVHPEGVFCPRAMVGFCIDCGQERELNRYWQCRSCLSHSITRPQHAYGGSPTTGS